jgi:hypothetical protein
MEPVPNAEQFDLFERLRSEEIEWIKKLSENTPNLRRDKIYMELKT